MEADAVWVKALMGELALQITKGTTPTTAGFSYQIEGIPFVKVENINDNGICAGSITQFISEDAHNALKRSQFAEGDVLFSIAGTIGKTALVKSEDIPANTNQAVAIIRGIDAAFEPYFLQLQLKKSASEISKTSGRGGAMNNISLSDLKAVEVIVPPLAEQKVIAEKLDTLLAQVETTKARLDRIPHILKRFRQSVLAAAVSGKLTEDWRGANIDRKKLSIADVCSSAFDGPFGSKLKTADYTDFGVRVARLENIGHLFFDKSKETYISEEKFLDLKKNTLLPGDVLFSSFVDEEVRVCVFDIKSSIYINKADCFCLRPDLTKVNSKYLAFTLGSVTSYEKIKNEVQGVTRPRINLKLLKSLEFDFPAIKEQTEIVRRVERLFAFADKIEQQVQQAQQRVNHLTQSILAKAFRGELTEQWRRDHPDLIRGEHSAQALLEKIRAEREAMNTKKTPRKTTKAKKVKA